MENTVQSGAADELKQITCLPGFTSRGEDSLRAKRALGSTSNASDRFGGSSCLSSRDFGTGKNQLCPCVG